SHGADRVTDACTATAIGAAAADAFGGNNLQHLVGLTVDGAPGVQDGQIAYEVTTSNDEDGATTRKVLVVERGSSCGVASIKPLDFKKPSASDIKSSFKAVVDECTTVAIDAAAKKAFETNNLQHLHGLALDGDPAADGQLKYTITLGNEEDGDTNYAVSVQ